MTPGVALVLGLLLSTASGLALVAWAFGTAAPSLLAWIGRLALGAVVGLGVSSLTTFGWLFLAGGLGPRTAVADAFFCCLLAGGLLLLRRTREGLRAAAVERGELAATGLLLVAVAFATWRFVAATKSMPHGEWDAWEVWNYRARHLFRAGGAWREAFGSGLKSTEYPLLLPLAIARLWTYGGESLLAPAVVAGTFTLGSAWIVAGLVGAQAGVVAGSTAGLLLCGTTGFQVWGAQQYADVPLATLVAAAAGVLMLAFRADGAPRSSLLALGGLLLGLSGWTKTDGVVAAAIGLAVFLVWASRATEVRQRGRVLAALARVSAGAALPALAWVVQHVVLAPALAPVLSDGQSAPLSKFVDPERWTTVLRWFLDVAPGRELWLPGVAVGIALLQGLRPERLLGSPALWLAGSLWLVDLLVFVLTPLDLGFHLLTAADRLLLQAWPLFLLAVFAVVRAPARTDAHGPGGEGRT